MQWCNIYDICDFCTIPLKSILKFIFLDENFTDYSLDTFLDVIQISKVSTLSNITYSVGFVIIFIITAGGQLISTALVSVIKALKDLPYWWPWLCFQVTRCIGKLHTDKVDLGSRSPNRVIIIRQRLQVGLCHILKCRLCWWRA